MMELVHTRDDLPRTWDGVPVQWSEWSRSRTTLAYHAPATDLACTQCGAVDESLHAMGMRPPVDEHVTVERTKTTRSGHPYGVTVEVRAWPVYDLHVFRCRHCGHDTVLDDRTGQYWDLEATDYGPGGSNEPELETLW